MTNAYEKTLEKLSAQPAKTVTMNMRVVTEAERKAEKERERQAFRQRDVLDRLKSTHGVTADDKITIKDAIDEIEWLRASRPEDAVTRGEMDEMTAKLQEMQATLTTMLERMKR